MAGVKAVCLWLVLGCAAGVVPVTSGYLIYTYSFSPQAVLDSMVLMVAYHVGCRSSSRIAWLGITLVVLVNTAWPLAQPPGLTLAEWRHQPDELLLRVRVAALALPVCLALLFMARGMAQRVARLPDASNGRVGWLHFALWLPALLTAPLQPQEPARQAIQLAEAQAGAGALHYYAHSIHDVSGPCGTVRRARVSGWGQDRVWTMRVDLPPKSGGR